METTTVLSFNDVLITRNPRYSVKKEEGEENILNWKLVIHDVKKKDEGFYQCQLNTDPTKARNAYLEVTSMQLIHRFQIIFDCTILYIHRI